MPLTVVRRKTNGALTISGTLRLSDGSAFRIQRRAASDSLALARREAQAIQNRILGDDYDGKRGKSWTFDQAIIKYCEAKLRTPATKDRITRLRDALGPDLPIRDIDQDTITQLRAGLFAGAAEATILREAITPLRAVLRYAAKKKMCDLPDFETPEIAEGRTEFFLPAEAERLIAAAAPHLRPLLVFLFGTGARMSEALYLEWRDVDLVNGRVIFWADRTKAKKRRNVELPPRVVAALADLPFGLNGGRQGAVFRRSDGRPYAARSAGGGQIKKAWAGARRRAGLRPELTPHSCRHTWATWQFELHKNPLRLKVEGGWASLEQVERYAHLMPGGYEPQITGFLRWPQTEEKARSVA